MKLIKKLPTRGKYQKIYAMLKPGYSVKGLDKKTAFSVHRNIYRRHQKPTLKQENDGTYTLGIQERRKF